MKRKICMALTTRGNYAKMKSTMRAIMAHPDLELQVILAGGIVQEEFRDYGAVLAADGFTVDRRVDFLVNSGNTLADMTESAGRATIMIGQALDELAPDCLVVIADRYEALSIAFAAMCLNIPIAHLEGGEVSGSIDERIRHAITKLSHVHFVANSEAADRVERMGEARDTIHVVGTPSLDLLTDLDLGNTSRLDRADGGAGATIDFTQPYVAVSQHPVVTENTQAAVQLAACAAAIAQIGLPTVWILPNMDGGRDGILQALAELKAGGLTVPVRFFPSMNMENYATLLKNARCLIGNSSSGIRECAFLGVPVVNIGSRQYGRQRGPNVIDCGWNADEIAAAVRRQIAHGPYASCDLYGNGRCGARIADCLAAARPHLDKTITY